MTIQEKVAEQISNSGKSIIDSVVFSLASIEIDKRIKLVTKAVEKQEALEKEFKKSHKPDVEAKYDENRVIITLESYSKSRLDSIEKDKERLKNLVKQLETCLETNTQESYNKLSETLNKLGNAGGDKKENTDPSKSESQ
jgi:hypothetical protein